MNKLTDNCLLNNHFSLCAGFIVRVIALPMQVATFGLNLQGQAQAAEIQQQINDCKASLSDTLELIQATILAASADSNTRFETTLACSTKCLASYMAHSPCLINACVD